MFSPRRGIIMVMKNALMLTAIVTMAIIASTVFFYFLWKPFYANYQYEKCATLVKAEQQRRTDVDVQAKQKYAQLESEGMLPDIEVPGYKLQTTGMFQCDAACVAEGERRYILIEFRKEIGPDIDWAKPFSLESGLSGCKARYH